jgi:AraC-like DNA-binding protein
MAVDSDSLSKVLSSIDLRVGVGRRVTLEARALLPLPIATTTLVYVLAGSVRGNPPHESGCRVDIDESLKRVHIETERDQPHLVEGDVFLTLGTTPLALEAETGATLMVLELELADTMPALGSLLPEFVTIRAFGRLEPAAAALATNMGVPDSAVCPTKSGDSVICRMMAATLLLTLIRAWAANDCAPEGWPSLSTDPFLERVVDAIHDEPGHEWTVESLANVAVMSRSAFAARFRAVLGQSPANYVTDVRMGAAKRMLDAGRSVSEVSRELGYASDEGFSRAFRRHSGVTPSAWRMAHSIPLSA